ncbi:MAG: IS21 family transposase [Betaproteobacteria bacterium]|nr:IS21 family transposase [Betaproteobacteria bacterium]
MFQYRAVLVRLRQGDADRDIARSRLMSRRKLARFRAIAAREGWLAAQSPLPEDAAIAAAIGTARRARSSISTAEPHRAIVERWVAEGVSGVAIHAALVRNHGYTGSYSAVYRMLAAIRAALPPDVTVPLVFDPAEAAQVDFGAGPVLIDPASSKPRRTWCFVMTLCWSRHQYVEFVWDQTVPTWLGCHRRAFEWFGAVPRRLIIDNAKCAITRACAREPLVQRAYAECAEGYGFRIDACPPADPQKKGIVEAGVKYVKRNFIPTRTFRDMADLNEQAQRWVAEVAGVRIHGTTRERPLERFALEQPLMQALPAIAPDLGSWHQVSVHRDCHVQHGRILYSVPFALVGKRLWLRATDTSVSIYEDFRLVATHPRGRRAGERMTVREHLPPEAQAFFLRDRTWCVKQAAAIGAACTELIERLLADRILERLRAAQGVLQLAERYGAARLEAACARALYHASPYYRTVKTILAGGFDLQASDEAASEQPHAPGARFARDAFSLFNPDEHPQH